MAENEWKKRLGVLLSEAVNLEHQGFYFYLAAGIYFDSPKISLTNIRDFFYQESNDELKHAKILIEFINQLGLKLSLDGIHTVDVTNFSITEIFEKSKALEQAVLDNYMKIQKEADNANDYQTSQFIDYFLDMQTREVKLFHDRAMNARRCNNSLGEFLFDQSFIDPKESKRFKK